MFLPVKGVVVMRRKFAATLERPVVHEGCQHYWLIASPRGPNSRGVCQVCGAERDFQNFGPDLWREGDALMVFGLPGVPPVEPDAEADN